MEELVSTPAAASAFGVSPRSLARWTREGLLVPDHVTPQGYSRWSVTSLYRQFESLRAKADNDG